MDLFGFRDENQQCDPMFLAIESLTSADLLFERQNASTIQAGTKHLLHMLNMHGVARIHLVLFTCV